MRRRGEIWWGFAAFWAIAGVFVGVVTAARADQAASDAPKPPAAEQFIVVPLRVHVLSADTEEIDCKLADADVRRIVGKLNRVWRPAGVYFGLESIVHEPADHQEHFQAARQPFGSGPVPLNLYRPLLPEATRRATGGLHVYYVHKLPVNGVYMGEDFAVVQETAKLREVEGGIDEPVPRVTAHELGHALGLPHRQDRTNLMASGTTGTLLNAAEVETARARAEKIEGEMTVAACRDAAAEASKAGNEAKAARLRAWLGEIEAAPAGKSQ